MRLKLTIFSLLFLALSFSVVFENTSYAAFNISPGEITNRGGVDPSTQNSSIVSSILSGIYQISAMVAVLMLVISGVRYIISDGDPSRVQSARKGVIYSLVGLAIIGSAFIITGIIQGLFA